MPPISGEDVNCEVAASVATSEVARVDNKPPAVTVLHTRLLGGEGGHGRCRPAPCVGGKEGHRASRSWTDLALLVYALKSRAKADHLVRQLAGLRMDHHHHHHCQLRRHGPRRQVALRGQNRPLHSDGKSVADVRPGVIKNMNYVLLLPYHQHACYLFFCLFSASLPVIHITFVNSFPKSSSN